MNEIPILKPEDFARWGTAWRKSAPAVYYAMYSSLFGGIVMDPALMLIPLDDHMAHRGDGVFETFKCVQGSLYNLAAHLDRLLGSARQIALALPMSRNELVHAILQTVRAGGHQDCLVRLFVSRGPGSLGISPYDCPHSALYIAAYELKPPFMEQHPGGAKVKTSSIPARNAPFSNIKSVNYLPNVLMKKEAADAGVDFVACFDEAGYLAEGATENIGLVARDGWLCVPKPAHILAGTTMLRALELAKQLVQKGALAGIRTGDMARAQLEEAAEILVFGTTPDVTAVTEFDGQPVSQGQPGPIQQALNALLVADIHSNPGMQTPVFESPCAS